LTPGAWLRDSHLAPRTLAAGAPGPRRRRPGTALAPRPAARFPRALVWWEGGCRRSHPGGGRGSGTAARSGAGRTTPQADRRDVRRTYRCYLRGPDGVRELASYGPGAPLGS